MFNIKGLWFDFWRKRDEYKTNIFNSIFFRIDKIMGKTFDDKLSDPPESPENGDMYRVGDNATGRWEDKEDFISFYYNGSWRLIAPSEGMHFYDKSIGKFLYYDGSVWKTVSECFADHNALHNYCEFEHEDWSDPGALKIDRERITEIVNVKIGNKFGEGNYMSIDSDGHMILVGDATVFDDMKFPFSRDKQGQSSKPDFDFTNIGLLFPQNDPTEIVYIIAQFNHSRKLGSDIFPHIHFVQDGATAPTFKMDYRWYHNGDDPTVSFTTITFDVFAFTYVSGSIAQIVSTSGIDGSAIVEISSILECRIYRDDNDVSGDVLSKEFDIHYEIDSMGSNQEFTKYK